VRAMNSEASLEAVLPVVAGFGLGLIHFWNYKRSASRKRAAEEALRLDAIRQEAVNQLKAEHRIWSGSRQGLGM
jgi:hypothetical protein